MSQYLVDADFDSLGYAYSNDNRSTISKLAQACRALWAAVLEQEFHAPDLGRWAETRDFSAVCEYAGVEPDLMREAARKIVCGKAALKLRRGSAKKPRKATEGHAAE